MNKTKQRKLEENGWKVGTIKDFLNLSDADIVLIKLKIDLGRRLKSIRTAKHISQKDFARKINSTQSRVAKIESGAPDVTLEQLIESLIIAGETPKNIGDVIATIVI